MSSNLLSWQLSVKVGISPMGWEGRGVTLSRHELKLLSLNLPNCQMTRAAAPLDLAALKRMCTCGLWNAGHLLQWQQVTEGSATPQAQVGKDAISTGAGLRIRGPVTPAPGGGRRLSWDICSLIR